MRALPPGRPALQDWLEVVLWVAIFLASALTAPVGASGAPNAPGDAWLREHTGGGLCLFKRVTGADCPGCGLSRGFVQIAHGHPLEAMKLNPFSPVVFVLIACRLVHFLVFCLVRLDVKNRVPWSIAWKLHGSLGAGFFLLGVYRVALRFMPEAISR